MTTPAPTHKEAIWLACKKKSCCYSAVVVPSGRDVWRIARTLDNPPWAFCVYFRAPGPRGDAFILDRSGLAFHLALAKQPSRRTKTPPPCIFLLKTRDGAHLCGLGPQRPETCKTFPSEIVGGVVCMRPDAGCTCRRWTLNDVDIAQETAALAVRDADFVEYCTVVARWNAQVRAAPPDTAFTFFDYCNFVLEAYDAITVSAAPVAAV